MLRKLIALAALSVMAVACGGAATSAPKAPPPPEAAKADVARVVDAMRGDLKACYDEGRRLNPMLEGGFVAEVRVGVAGSVESIDAQDVVGLNRAVIDCMTKRMQSAHFPAPGETGATVRIPVHFET